MGTNNKPESYEGGREVKDFIKFIKRKATNDVVLAGKKDKSELWGGGGSYYLRLVYYFSWMFVCFYIITLLIQIPYHILGTQRQQI